MHRFDKSRLDLAREFKANPFGKHGPDLQYLLHIMRQPGVISFTSCWWTAQVSAGRSPFGSPAAAARQVMELNFVLDQDINQPDRLAPILTELGLPAPDILDQAQAEPTKTRLREQTEHARARGIFGAPTFFVGAEMFWGNDRLDDALLFASDRML